MRLATRDLIAIRSEHLPLARLMRPIGSDDPDAWALYVLHVTGEAELQGADAMRVASRLLARINAVGAADRTVQRAVQRLEHEGGAERLFGRIAARPGQEPSAWARFWAGGTPGSRYDPSGTLRSLPVADRLALEMATHEETERRALEGELAALETAWRDAEEIAAIADSLALPPRVDEFVERHRAR